MSSPSSFPSTTAVDDQQQLLTTTSGDLKVIPFTPDSWSMWKFTVDVALLSKGYKKFIKEDHGLPQSTSSATTVIKTETNKTRNSDDTSSSEETQGVKPKSSTTIAAIDDDTPKEMFPTSPQEAKVFSFLTQSLKACPTSANYVRLITGCEPDFAGCSYRAWAILTNKFEKKTPSRVLMLTNKFTNITHATANAGVKRDPNMTSMEVYILALDEAIRDLKDVGKAPDEETCIIRFIHGLPDTADMQNWKVNYFMFDASNNLSYEDLKDTFLDMEKSNSMNPFGQRQQQPGRLFGLSQAHHQAYSAIERTTTSGEICRHFQKTGNCKFGSKCRHIHQSSNNNRRPSDTRYPGRPANNKAFMTHKSAPACFNFSRTGSCKFGDKCKYQHGNGAATARLPNNNYNNNNKRTFPKEVTFAAYDDQERNFGFMALDLNTQLAFKATKEGTCPIDLSHEIVIDSACSTHASGNNDILTNFIELPALSFVTAANQSVIPIRYKATGTFKASTGSMIKLQPTLYSDQFPTTLVSVKAMTASGCTVVFRGHACKVFSANQALIMTATLRNGLYLVDRVSPTSPPPRLTTTPVEKNKSFAYVAATSIDVWHQRLGHANIPKLRTIKQQELTGTELQLDTSQQPSFCEDCAITKSTRKKRRDPRVNDAKEPLDLVHSDVAFFPTKQGEFIGYASFIDDVTDFAAVRILKTKTGPEMLDHFKSYKASAELQHNRKIKVFRCDNGGEYLNDDFQQFLRSEGITCQPTSPYHPEENGKAERFNRTMKEMVRAQLHHGRLSPLLWSVCLINSCLLKNCITLITINGKLVTPYEAWFKRKPNLNQMRVFGCDAYIHVHTHTDALAPRAVLGIHFGYDMQRQCYKIYSLVSERIIYTNDVRFNETSFKAFKSSLTEMQKAELDADLNSAQQQFLQEEAKIEHKHDDEEEETTVAMSSSPLPTSTNDDPLNAPLPMVPVTPLPTAEPEPSNDDMPPLESPPEPPTLPPPVTMPTSATPPPAVEPIATTNTSSRPTRNRTMPSRYANSDYVLSAVATNVETPISFKAAMQSKERNKWSEAADSEYQSLLKNNTWIYVARPSSRKVLKAKWVYKLKLDKDGQVERYKARWVAKGYEQIDGFDYNETFSPVASMNTFRTAVAIAAAYNCTLYHLDISTAFLYGDLEEEIFLEQPEGYDDGSGRVCLLKKSLYGLKQSGRCWYYKLHTFLLGSGFKPSLNDPCVYTYSSGPSLLICIVYVDDLLFAVSLEGATHYESIKAKLSATFKLNDLGVMNFFLGIQVQQNANSITLSQATYVKQLLETFEMHQCNVVPTPSCPSVKFTPLDFPNPPTIPPPFPYRQAVGKLLYASGGTRPDISQAVGNVSRYMHNPGEKHWNAVKRIMRYLRGTADNALTYQKGNVTIKTPVPIQVTAKTLFAYADANWEDNKIDGRSTTGYDIFLAGGPIAWKSKKQPTVALSSTEAEYMANADCAREVTWLRRLLTDMGCPQSQPTLVLADNQGCIQLANNPSTSSRTKHIDLRHHYIQEAVRDGKIKMEFISTKENLADIHTKPLLPAQFSELRHKLMQDKPPNTWKGTEEKEEKQQE